MAELNPWQTLEALRRELDRVFDGTSTRNEPFFHTAFLPGRAARRYPLINLYEDKDAVYLEALAPGVDPATLNRAVIDERIAGFRRAIRQDEHDETAHYGLGVAYFNLGLLDEAAEELTIAARLMPENPNIQAQLAVVFADLAARGKPVASQQAWDRLPEPAQDVLDEAVDDAWEGTKDLAEDAWDTADDLVDDLGASLVGWAR